MKLLNYFVGETIYLRLFEPSDFEYTYKWRNDYNIQKMVCGPMRFVSKEIEKIWVQNKSTNNNKDIYLAICIKKNDKMIGYYSINDIDLLNRSCHCGGIVIGDKEYQDGTAYMEVGKLVVSYLFNELNMHRITGSCLREHISSRASMETGNWKLEGIQRDKVFKQGKYHDVCLYSLLEEEYRDSEKHPLSEIEYAKKYTTIAKEIKKEIKKIY